MTEKLTIVCRDFKPLHRNSLLGFATIEIVELHMRFFDVTIHQKGESRWAQLAAKPQIGKDGNVIRDSAGKIKYSAVTDFRDEATRKAFSHKVCEAVAAFAPDAFEKMAEVEEQFQ